MPLDLVVVREHVRWSGDASAALREGVEELEDHLIELGYDDLELRIQVQGRPAGLAAVQADLGLPIEPISRHAEDLDLSLLITRVLDDVRGEVTRERLAQGGALPRPQPPDDADPWTAVLRDLYAIAHREVTQAIDFGDLPPGWVDTTDLTDQAVLESLDVAVDGAGPPSLRELARRVRGLLRERIYAARVASAEDFPLDEVVDRVDPSEDAAQDEYYEFRVVDEAPLRGEDVVGSFDSPEDRIERDEPTDPG